MSSLSRLRERGANRQPAMIVSNPNAAIDYWQHSLPPNLSQGR
ncbi:hypothetical protein CNECB9_4140004 [Cupriavidus necator]|uniref:Uncharacterized protein n=1 Tax=Cupriavidus necator TaxID=106590 RepID=A0A1K0JIR2_CUPNE|nr:hypothetical protein CNECB9_4140004 [Cupriavidus necator]